MPEGYEKSMTHLEYDEAQKMELPSLIYILEDSQPILRKMLRRVREQRSCGC